MLIEISQLDIRLRELFASEADPEPDEILDLTAQRQQLLQGLMSTLSVEHKQQLLAETQDLLRLAQRAKLACGDKLAVQKRGQRGVNAYRQVSTQ
ncbi:hypothetical protein [Plesiomonas shigelloides]|uniref:hypothetical protein n=1 Tax=Plesiomonas shigelloides TaxID=703 RepID=UPI0022461673|nr:hypothetical protein [Plesiomonas shigelloides]MCX2497447.1 hypothetical protein [Plesiomonas shigelloides]